MNRLLAALLLAAAFASAETRSGLVLIPMPEDRAAELDFEINGYLQSETDAGFDYDMRFFGAKGRVRLDPEAGRRSLLLGFDLFHLDTDTADARVPGKLTESSIALGGGYPVGDWILQATIGAGFAGDKPFTGQGWYGLASVSGTRFFDKTSFLTLGLDFDGNRPIFPDIPLPVLLWTKIWNKQLRTSIGFPFLGIAWTPAEWIEFNFRGIPGVFQTGDIIVHAGTKWDLFARYRAANFRFYIDEYPNNNDRLFYGEQRVELGVTWKPNEGAELTLVAGWAFEREFSTGFDVRDTDTLVRIDKGAVLGFSFSFRF
ncbi:MAG: hypothetical protein ACYTEG_00595 [Planctomycetota bacterium]|jgi:hypothetical protein